jgi:hypothetical protein
MSPSRVSSFMEPQQLDIATYSLPNSVMDINRESAELELKEVILPRHRLSDRL